MVQNLVAVFSLLIGTAGLLLSYAGHRQKTRQDAQDRALRADEQQRMEHDREQERQRQDQEARARREREARDREREARARREREARAQWERDRYQASMIGGHIGLSPSSLDDSWVVPQVVINNGSNQPVRDLRATFRGEVTNELRLVGTGRHYFPLPPVQISGERYDQLGQVTVEFTDVAGVRWRREGYGALQRARQGADGQEVWGNPEPPVVERVVERPDTALPRKRSEVARPPQAQREPTMPAPAQAGPPAPAPAERRVGCLGPVVVLGSVVLIAGGIWWLLH
ncbi:hypothetical protein [Streptomyces sp. NPDC056948]|uniref:hypothetical protein n=1 Tax=Streptomyces sp. NPDC056948 TaxID=3345975 RepID=UPI0036366D8D